MGQRKLALRPLRRKYPSTLAGFGSADRLQATRGPIPRPATLIRTGGLIGCGHPVGATGVRMALDAFKQTTGTAGDYQVEGARTVQTLNIGGSTTTTVSFVIGV